MLKEKADKRGWTYHQHLGPHDLNQTNWVLPGRDRIVDVARNLGVHFIVAPKVNNKSDAIEAGRNFLSMCWIDAVHCKDGVEALDNYRVGWDEDRKTWKRHPEHDWASHGADALLTGACSFVPEYIPPAVDRYQRKRARASAWAA